LDVNGASISARRSCPGTKFTVQTPSSERSFSIGTTIGPADAALPGGDIPRADFAAFLRHFLQRHAWLPERLALRYAHAYGTRAARILASARSARDLGDEVLPGLYAAEIDYLRREEWAVTAEDVLLRRTKLALHVPEGSADVLDAWLTRNRVTTETAR